MKDAWVRGHTCPESQGDQIVGGMTGPGKGLGPSPEGESICAGQCHEQT